MDVVAPLCLNCKHLKIICTSRTAENGAGSQNSAADSYEMASLEEKKEKSTVEDIKKPSKVDVMHRIPSIFLFVNFTIYHYASSLSFLYIFVV